MLWAAGVAVPPTPLDETALYESRASRASRIEAPRRASVLRAAERSDAPAPPAPGFAPTTKCLPPAAPIALFRGLPLYLRHCALLL